MKKLKFEDVKTQKDAVVYHLQEFGNLTSWMAIKEYGITRLSSIIYYLKEEGFIIENVPETKLNRFGNSTTIANYHLKNSEDLTGQRKLF